MVRQRLRMEAGTEHASVTSLELFFDLVFVFGITQVTGLMAADLTWRGVLRGTFVLALLWWSWTGYAWLGNVVRADEGACRFVVLAAMAAMLVLALSIPEAFDDLPGGLPGPVVVALCYFGFRTLHILLFWVIARGDRQFRMQILHFAPAMLGGTTLLLAASQFQGRTQTILWGVALLVDYGGTFLGGSSGWRLRSASHFAERHGLIVLIALGESIVAIGVGIAGLPLTWAVVVAAILGLAVAAAQWWMYFDVTSIFAERALAAMPEAQRVRVARDAYSFLHLPLVAGVVFIALGMKKVLEYAGDLHHHQLSDPLTGIPLFALFGGGALYLLAHTAFKLVTTGHNTPQRFVASIVLVVLLPAAASIPAMGALAILAVVMSGVVAYETLHFAEARAQVRHEGHDHEGHDHEGHD